MSVSVDLTRVSEFLKGSAEELRQFKKQIESAYINGSRLFEMLEASDCLVVVRCIDAFRIVGDLECPKRERDWKQHYGSLIPHMQTIRVALKGTAWLLFSVRKGDDHPAFIKACIGVSRIMVSFRDAMDKLVEGNPYFKTERISREIKEDVDEVKELTVQRLLEIAEAADPRAEEIKRDIAIEIINILVRDVVLRDSLVHYLRFERVQLGNSLLREGRAIRMPQEGTPEQDKKYIFRACRLVERPTAALGEASLLDVVSKMAVVRETLDRRFYPWAESFLETPRRVRPHDAPPLPERLPSLPASKKRVTFKVTEEIRDTPPVGVREEPKQSATPLDQEVSGILATAPASATETPPPPPPSLPRTHSSIHHLDEEVFGAEMAWPH